LGGAGGVVEVAKVVEGVGFKPLDVAAFGERGVEKKVAVGGFECGAAGVDSGDMRAGLGEMESETALVGADV
jgi:hypothetical protein